MEIEQYIDENYNELFDYIREMGVRPHNIDHDEIEMWIMNDEFLYNTAISEGVDI